MSDSSNSPNICRRLNKLADKDSFQLQYQREQALSLISLTLQSNLQNLNTHAANIRNQEVELGVSEDEVMVTPIIVENGGANNDWSKRAEIMDSSMGNLTYCYLTIFQTILILGQVFYQRCTVRVTVKLLTK